MLGGDWTSKTAHTDATHSAAPSPQWWPEEPAMSAARVSPPSAVPLESRRSDLELGDRFAGLDAVAFTPGNCSSLMTYLSYSSPPGPHGHGPTLLEFLFTGTRATETRRHGGNFVTTTPGELRASKEHC